MFCTSNDLYSLSVIMQWNVLLLSRIMQAYRRQEERMSGVEDRKRGNRRIIFWPTLPLLVLVCSMAYLCRLQTQNQTRSRLVWDDRKSLLEFVHRAHFIWTMSFDFTLQGCQNRSNWPLHNKWAHVLSVNWAHLCTLPVKGPSVWLVESWETLFVVLSLITDHKDFR